MEFIIRFMVNLFDLGLFWYYFHCFKQMKKVPKGFFAAYLVTMAAIWAAVYGNLLDNAIEACRKVPEGKRFIRLENKYQSGKLLLVITNSKTMEKNENLKTTKKDSYSHGRGILSVQRVADKYNGTAGFTDKGEVFEASVMLYGIEVG